MSQEMRRRASETLRRAAVLTAVSLFFHLSWFAPETIPQDGGPPEGSADTADAPGEGEAGPPAAPEAAAASGGQGGGDGGDGDGGDGDGGEGADPAAEAAGEEDRGTPPREIQLSFSGADIDFVVRWLAEMTGKSVIKHKGVTCELTIVSPRELPLEEALQLVYRNLALEGVSVIENRRSILLVPEEVERQMGPRAFATGDDLEGQQIIVRVFELEHAEAAKLRDQVKSVLSDKAKVEIDERANKLIVTDTADNVRLVAELISQLDVLTETETTTLVFPVTYGKAEELVTILDAIFAPKAPPQQKGQPQKKPPQPSGPDVRFMADRTANRIIVTAPLEMVPEIKKLIETLDTDKPDDVAIRVLPLEHVSASDLVNELGPFYEKLRGESLKDLIEVGANSRSNSLIVLSSTRNFEAIKQLVATLDTEEAQKKTIKSFALEHADAEDVVEHLNELFGKTSDDDSYYYGYYYYRYMSQEGDMETRFVSDRRRNAVIAIAPPKAFDAIEQMIAALDEPVDGESLAPRIYQLKYISAFDVEELLTELFTRREMRRGYFWDPYEEEDRDVGKLYGKVRVTSEFYTNSLIVTSNSEENFVAIESILEQLDVPSETGDTTLTVRLKFAKAVTIANNLNIMFAQRGAPPRQQRPRNQQQRQGGNQGQQGELSSSDFELEEEEYEESYFPWLGSSPEGGPGGSRLGSTLRPVSDLVGKVRVVPDARTNSVIISSNSHLLPSIVKVIEELDVPTAQVLLEAKIVEVSSDFRDRLGVRWSPDGNRVFEAEDFDDSIIGTGSAEYQEVFAGSLLADAMRTGILQGSVNLDILIQFLKKNTESHVLAEPRINVEDNERGKLFVGSRVPFISSSLQTTEGGRTDSFRYIDVGIILEVTPHINETGDVALGIRVESSQIRPGETLFGGAIIDTRNYRTDLTVKSGETLVLGGIIQKEETDVVRKFPILGDIPLLGYLFKKRDTILRDVELMVFLRPQVTRTPEEVRELMESERKKAHRVRRWEERLEEEMEERAEEGAE